MSKNHTIISLCDFTGAMIEPWREAGFRCVTVDIRDIAGVLPGREHICADVRDLARDPAGFFGDVCGGGVPLIVFSFPPCTNLAASGARWFRSKGLRGLIEGLELVESCRVLCEHPGVPWMLENPVGSLSTYWRKPDHIFHPSDYTGYELGDNYLKKTCLWVGGGFVMPSAFVSGDLGEPDRRIWKAPDSRGRADFRSKTPLGFARGVFTSNAP